MRDKVSQIADAIYDRYGPEVSAGMCEAIAKLAVEQMRDPTPKMLRAAGAAMSPGKRPTEKRVSERAKHGIRYRAMIDAATGGG